MAKMKIADMRSRVTIQSGAIATSGTPKYARATTWTDVDTVWANIKPAPGLLHTRTDDVAPETTHIITIRHRTDINRAHRVLYGSREFRIHRLINYFEGKAKFLILHCEEVDPTL